MILVTGGASGIGEAVVRRAGAIGARMAVVERNLEAALALAEAVGARGYGADVTSLEDMQRVCAQVVHDHGRLDGAVNNAGIGGEWGTIQNCSPANWDRTIAVNLTGVFNSLKAEISHFLAAGGGSIVNMSSTAGVLAEPGLPAYIAAKHGVVGLTKSTALDFGARGIRCNAVCPSFIRTPMTVAGISVDRTLADYGEAIDIGRDDLEKLFIELLGRAQRRTAETTTRDRYRKM